MRNLINRFTIFCNKLIKKGALHILLGSFLTKFVTLFGSIILVRILSKSQYGNLAYLENLYGYIYVLSGMGYNNSILRYVVLGKNTEEKTSYFMHSIKRGLIFNFILIVLAGIALMYYPHPKEFVSIKWLSIIMLIAIPFQFLLDCSMVSYRAMFANKRFALASFIITVSVVLGRLFGAKLFGLNGVIASKIFIPIILGIPLIFISIKSFYNINKNYIISYTEKKEMLKYSVQSMVTDGLWIIFMLNDTFLLGRILGDSSIIADYKVASVLPGSLALFSMAIGVFIGPYFVKNETNHNWVWEGYKKVMYISGSITLILTLFLAILAEPIIIILYGVHYRDVVMLMRLLLISSFINSAFRYTSAHLLSSMGKVKYNMIVSILGILIQITLNLIIIPKYGVYGLAFTDITVYLFMAVTLYLIFRKIYKTNYYDKMYQD